MPSTTAVIPMSMFSWWLAVLRNGIAIASRIVVTSSGPLGPNYVNSQRPSMASSRPRGSDRGRRDVITIPFLVWFAMRQNASRKPCSANGVLREANFAVQSALADNSVRFSGLNGLHGLLTCQSHGIRTG